MKFVECRTLHYRVSDRERTESERAVKGKNWVWNSVGKKEGSMRSETFAPRAAVPVLEGQREERREGTLTKQPALFSGFLFLPFVERQRREEIRSGFGNAAADAAAVAHRSVTVGLLRDGRTSRRTRTNADGQRSELQCRALY